MTHTHAKGQGKRSFSSKVKVEKDVRRTDGGECITSRASANYNCNDIVTK